MRHDVKELKEQVTILLQFINGKLQPEDYMGDAQVPMAMDAVRRLLPATLEPNPDLIADVQAFGEKYGLPLSNTPHLLAPKDWEYRENFLREELAETVKGYYSNDLEEVADGLIDLIYVAIGTLQLMGIPVAEGWREVQRANMAKERVASAEGSKRGHAWDIKKPEGWEPPDWRRVLQTATDVAYVEWEKSQSSGPWVVQGDGELSAGGKA